jgi:hypothetical protein
LAASSLILAAPLQLQVLFFALAGALACKKPLHALVVTPLSVSVGVLGAAAASRLPWGAPAEWMGTLILTVAAAGVLAAILAFVLDRYSQLAPVAGVLGVATILAMSLSLGVSTASTPRASGASLADALGSAPAITRSGTDEVLYLNVISRLRNGQPYYPAFAQVLAKRNEVGPGTVSLNSPSSFRLPTLYTALAHLPGSGMSLVLAMLAVGSLASVSAFLLVKSLATDVLGLMAAATVAAFYTSYAGSVALVNAEPWAAALGLCSVALLSLALRRDDIDRRVAATAAAVALAAAMTRELAVAFILLGLVVSVVVGGKQRRTLWIPWAVALAAFAGLYAWHASATAAAVQTVPNLLRGASGFNPGVWFHPDGSGLMASMSRYAITSGLNEPAAWALVLLAVIGALLGSRDGKVRVLLGLAVLGGLAALSLLRPNMSGTVGPPGYWGDVFLPTLLATIPLGLSALRTALAGRR